MTSKDLRERYLKFFENKGHKIIPSAPLVPENDASTLFISAGMQPLVPYLLGETHPEGVRLVNCQKCIRTGDIDEVGDAFHHTFFEMLGNWSLGDYFKQESIPWSYEFLTQELNISPHKLSVSVFAGDDDAPRDDEAAEIWKSVGIPEDRIYFFGKDDNWWAAGPVGPCGPDTEIFYDVTGNPCGPDCRPGDNCGRYFEIWNNVFMVYNRLEDGTLEELPKKNVDTGMGLERTLAVLNGLDDNYESDLFKPVISLIEEHSAKSYSEFTKEMRIIADHVKAASFLLAEGITPYKEEKGYVVRRLIREAIKAGNKIGIQGSFLSYIATSVVDIYLNTYPELYKYKDKIYNEFSWEEERYYRDVLSEKVLQKAALVQDKNYVANTNTDIITGSAISAFQSLATYGVPPEMSLGYAKSAGTVSENEVPRWWEEFQNAKIQHQQKSRVGAEQKFKGGLAGDTPITRKLHTTAHLLQASLRKILGDHVQQAGQNITDERLRFDFKHTQALTEDEKKEVEQMINEKIKEDLPVTSKVMPKDEAENSGALAFFKEKYGDQVSVYTIGDEDNFFSREFCGGPHITHTGEIGHVTITKEESAGAGIRRIYAKLD